MRLFENDPFDIFVTALIGTLGVAFPIAKAFTSAIWINHHALHKVSFNVPLTRPILASCAAV